MAKVCSNCGAQIQDGVKFCGKCGQKVPVETSEPKVCPNCGAPIQDGVKFCGKCGQKIQVKQTTAPQQRQDTAPPQRQDTAPPQRQDTEPPQQNQISADEAKENIKNFFSGGFQSAVEKFSALSLKNKAICVAVVVIALSMLFGGNSKTNSPKVQGKYLGMTVQDFAKVYNDTIIKLFSDKDGFQIVNTEVSGNVCYYKLKASECVIIATLRDGELAAFAVEGDRGETMQMINILAVVMEVAKDIDSSAVLQQIIQGRGNAVIETNGVRIVVKNGSKFLVYSQNFNPAEFGR